MLIPILLLSATAATLSDIIAFEFFIMCLGHDSTI